jgi:hypothetical protein
VRRFQSLANGIHPRILDITSTRIRNASDAGSEMDGVAAAEIFDANGGTAMVRLRIRKRFAQTREVRGVGEDGEVRVAAKLGRAVKHARLSAHEQGADAVRAHRRKDFAYRVRDQVSLRARGRFARVSRFPASVATA